MKDVIYLILQLEFSLLGTTVISAIGLSAGCDLHATGWDE